MSRCGCPPAQSHQHYGSAPRARDRGAHGARHQHAPELGCCGGCVQPGRGPGRSCRQPHCRFRQPHCRRCTERRCSCRYSQLHAFLHLRHANASVPSKLPSLVHNLSSEFFRRRENNCRGPSLFLFSSPTSTNCMKQRYYKSQSLSASSRCHCQEVNL